MIGVLTALLLAVRLPAPTISPASGTYSPSVTVSVSSRATGQVTYCAEGATPKRTAAQKYTGSWTITGSGTHTIQCRSYANDGRLPSKIVTASYSVSVSALADCGTNPFTGSAYPTRTGQTYYFCDCVATSPLAPDATCSTYQGNNANDGLSASSPKQTGWKDKFRALLAGQTVALCRGGAFSTDDVNVNNGNCTASSTCDLRDYTPPGAPSEWAGDQTKRPILSGLRVAYLGASTNTVGMRFFNLQSINGSDQGAFMGGHATDVDICNVRVSNAAMGIYLAPENARWAVRSCQFYEFTYRMAIYGASDDGSIDFSYFDNTSFGRGAANGSDYFLAHPIYLQTQKVQGSLPVYGMKVRNNEIHGCPASTPDTWGTVLLLSHGNFRNLLIENNSIICDNPPKGGSQWGIGLGNGGYAVADQSEIGFKDTIIRGNRIVGHGSEGIWLSQGQGSIIEDNIIEIPAGVESGGVGIIVGGETQRAGSTDLLSTNVTVRNNTIISLATATITAIEVKSEGTQHNVTNNAIYFGGTAGRCFNFPLAAGAYDAITGTACNGTRNTTYGDAPISLTSAAFENYATRNLTPAASSVLLNAGTAASTCTVKGTASQPCYAPTAPSSVNWDPADAFKNRGSQPDIGAMER